MTDLEYIIQDIKPQFERFKQDGVLRLSPSDSVKVREIYIQHYGKPMGTCSNCFTEQLYSLIVRCESLQKEVNTIATDEQPKRRRRK